MILSQRPISETYPDCFTVTNSLLGGTLKPTQKDISRGGSSEQRSSKTKFRRSIGENWRGAGEPEYKEKKSKRLVKQFGLSSNRIGRFSPWAHRRFCIEVHTFSYRDGRSRGGRRRYDDVSRWRNGSCCRNRFEAAVPYGRKGIPIGTGRRGVCHDMCDAQFCALGTNVVRSDFFTSMDGDGHNIDRPKFNFVSGYVVCIGHRNRTSRCRRCEFHRLERAGWWKRRGDDTSQDQSKSTPTGSTTVAAEPVTVVTVLSDDARFQISKFHNTSHIAALYAGACMSTAHLKSVDLDYEVINNMLMVSASGTAVTVS